MRYSAMLTLLLMLAPADGPPPAYADPPAAFKVEVRDYSACLKAVDAGRVVYLAVGVAGEKDDYTTPSLAGVTPGRYECRRENGVRVMRAVQRVLQSLPAVQFTGPFGGSVRIGSG